MRESPDQLAGYKKDLSIWQNRLQCTDVMVASLHLAFILFSKQVIQ